jgi:hypothetical protein
VIAIADKAQNRRLCRRFRKLAAEPAPKIVVAIARELTGFLWGRTAAGHGCVLTALSEAGNEGRRVTSRMCSFRSIPGAKLSPRPESQMTRDFAFLAGLASASRRRGRYWLKAHRTSRTAADARFPCVRSSNTNRCSTPFVADRNFG